MGFAENTSVPVERSRAEIESLLSKYGADQFMSGWDKSMAVINFRCHDRYVRFLLPLPERDEFVNPPVRTGRKRTQAQIDDNWQQEMRRRWRAMALVIKAKLEAVATGITSFEEEFLAHIVLPDGGTVGKFMMPQVETAYATGKMPGLLPMP